MKQVALIKFQDTDAQDEAFVVVRADERGVALGLSLEKDGDLEVFMPHGSARALIAALQDAVSLESKH